MVWLCDGGDVMVGLMVTLELGKNDDGNVYWPCMVVCVRTIGVVTYSLQE